MYVLIAGGGRTAAQLANLLLSQHHTVQVVEHRREVLARLHQELPTEVICEGSVTDPQILEHAGVRQAHVLVSALSSDADSLALCYFARERFNVPRIIAVVNDPRNAWLFDAKFHVDVALNQAEVLANLIEEEMSLGDMMILLKLRRGRYSLVEEKIPAGARAVGMTVKELPLPPNCVIAALIRHGQIVMPRGATTFEVDDEVLAIVDRAAAEDLAALFGHPHGTPTPGELRRPPPGSAPAGAKER
jgi:trk system potassium uptake protein TrkA